MSTTQSGESLSQKMYTSAAGAYLRAELNARQMGHGTMSDTHLLLGILAYGQADAYAPVPRILRDELGADYQELHAFLESRAELRTYHEHGMNFMPVPSQALRRTIDRASRNATLRPSGRDLIIMTDLMVGLVGSSDPLLRQALRSMKVDRAKLRTKFAAGTGAHLQPVL